ncbi:hypothetical protein [Cesiribacter andamanensis]|uniref:Secreted protein n=1 Tax=Cesiribacter andamanensis AMV16 TaxID=1279009 RepID=M7NAG7_9BACT|nr:hypothetical protein [Cesiribacter andamanensis]EMR04247.1 hypothetical protein ADICEAN_00655 [Cesiribacter andamanensis AMV16]
MKTKPYLFTKSLLLLLLLALSPSLHAQETGAKTAEFTWELNVDKDRITIRCAEGCAFTNLAFSSNRTVTLNQVGMLDLAKNPDEASSSDFLITYQKKGNKVILTGIKGVAWTELSFIAGRASYTLDQNGLRASH